MKNDRTKQILHRERTKKLLMYKDSAQLFSYLFELNKAYGYKMTEKQLQGALDELVAAGDVRKIYNGKRELRYLWTK